MLNSSPKRRNREGWECCSWQQTALAPNAKPEPQGAPAIHKGSRRGLDGTEPPGDSDLVMPFQNSARRADFSSFSIKGHIVEVFSMSGESVIVCFLEDKGMILVIFKIRTYATEQRKNMGFIRISSGDRVEWKYRSDGQNFPDCLYGRHWKGGTHPWFNRGFGEHVIGLFLFLVLGYLKKNAEVITDT